MRFGLFSESVPKNRRTKTYFTADVLMLWVVEEKPPVHPGCVKVFCVFCT